MSLTGRNRVMVMLAVLALALSLAARSAAAKGSKAVARATVQVSENATLAGKQLKPGTYNVRASESTLTLSQNGKVVAEAPIEWNNEATGSPSSAVMIDSGAVTEVHFEGKTRYARITSASEPSTGQK